jgi:flagellar motor protein MotB
MRGEQPGTFSGDDDSYLASVSDLMVGMLFVFIIMLMGFALSYRSAEEQAEQDRSRLMQDSAEVMAEREALMAQRDALGEVATELLERDEARAALLTGLQRELQGRAVAVTVDPANGVLRLPESLLFDSGAATLRPEGEAALQAVADALMQALPCVAEAPPALAERCPPGSAPLLEALLVEGHTDGQPIRGGTFADNWQLASARGVNTFKALTAARPDLELLRNVRGEALLGVSAYEARRPVTTGTSLEQRRLNRRIDLRFLVAAPAGDDLERLRRRFDAASRP